MDPIVGKIKLLSLLKLFNKNVITPKKIIPIDSMLNLGKPAINKFCAFIFLINLSVSLYLLIKLI